MISEKKDSSHYGVRFSDRCVDSLQVRNKRIDKNKNKKGINNSAKERNETVETRFEQRRKRRRSRKVKT